MDFIKDLSIDKIRNAAEDAINQVKPKSEVEARVYEVLSHKNWGSSSTLMNEVARDTYDYDKFPIVVKIMWEAMENQRPAAWRVVFKGLTLLEHLLKNGSERCVDDARNHSHTLRSLHQFNYYEGTVDRGSGVREMSKRLVEILSDDERIREERTKAKQLREKFGGNLGGVSSGGGGGSKYAGYGNDGGGWESGGGGGSRGGGYGDSGIGSSGFRSGGGGGGYGDDSGGGYSGRYSDGHDTPSGRGGAGGAPSAAPTFATMPEDKPRKTKKKSKKKKKAEDTTLEAPAPVAPEVDLFSFDAPAAPAPAQPAANGDAFDAFQSAPAAAIPPPAEPNNTQFDAFGTAPAPALQPIQTAQFDAFASGGNMTAMSNAFGGMAMQQQPAMNGAMGTQQQQVIAPPAGGDDDFGDFEDASSPTKAATTTAASSDPLSRLISLDGLSKNEKKSDKLHEPVIATPAAAQYVMDQQHGGMHQNPNSGMSFSGIDGLNKPIDLTPQTPTNSQAGSAPLGGMPNGQTPVLGTATAGGADVISMMGPPQAAMPNTSMQQQGTGGGQMGGGMTQQQMLMMQQRQMMMNQQQMGGAGMMNPGMQGNMQGGMSGMGMNQQMMMNQQQMGGGGMMNPNMQGGGGMYMNNMNGMSQPQQPGMGGQGGWQ